MSTIEINAGLARATIDPDHGGMLMDLALAPGDDARPRTTVHPLRKALHGAIEPADAAAALVPAPGRMRVVDRSPLHVRLLGRAGASEIMLRYEITPHAMEVDITINPVENGAGVFVWCVAPCDPVEDVSASEFAWRFAGVHRGHLRMKHMERSGVRIAGGMIACRIEGRSASARLELVTEGKA